jgi:anti-sigma B factor antagonist
MGWMARRPATAHPLEMAIVDMTVSDLGGQATCVRLSGRLDAAGADQIGVRFSATVASAGRPALIDLADVSFIASLGIRLLISTARSMASKGQPMVLYGAGELVRGVLDDVALDQIIPIVDTEAEALATLAD